MNKYVCGFFLLAILASCNQNMKESEKKPLEQISRTILRNNDSIPSESIFKLADCFQTQDDSQFRLKMLKGKPTVIAMIFTHCAYACPRLTADIKNIQDSLKDSKEKVNFVLVSFDTKRDSSARLKTFANEMGLNKNWILLHGNEETIRTLSVLLNVQYEEDADGNFSHSNLVSVLDKNGVLKYQKEGLGTKLSESIITIQELLQQK